REKLEDRREPLLPILNQEALISSLDEVELRELPPTQDGVNQPLFLLLRPDLLPLPVWDLIAVPTAENLIDRALVSRHLHNDGMSSVSQEIFPSTQDWMAVMVRE